jgi:Alpha-N-acetylglucosaminidase (NAGLU) C-terminal domain
MNLIIWWLKHIKRSIFVPTGFEYTLWVPRAEIVDYAAKQWAGEVGDFYKTSAN